MHPGGLANRLKAGIGTVSEDLATLGRLRALDLLAASDISQMLAAGFAFANALDGSRQLETFLLESFQAKPSPIEWPAEYFPSQTGCLDDGVIECCVLREHIAALSQRISTSVSDLLSDARISILAEPAVLVLERLAGSLPRPSGEVPTAVSARSTPKGVPKKILSGPSSVRTDPIFTKCYSLRQHPGPSFVDDPGETVAYLWTLSNREVLASQLCALSAVEYDGLPIQFYWDMAKQAWDEARHAMFFLHSSLSLLGEIPIDRDLANRPPWLALDHFRATGRGLPIPFEGNLYESMLNADLVERLVLMNIRTEAPAVGRKLQRIRSSFCQAHEALADGYEFDRFDEASHATIGKRWLEFLLPDENERKARLEEADLLRNVYLLTSFSHHGGGTMTDLLSKYIA